MVYLLRAIIPGSPLSRLRFLAFMRSFPRAILRRTSTRLEYTRQTITRNRCDCRHVLGEESVALLSLNLFHFFLQIDFSRIILRRAEIRRELFAKVSLTRSPDIRTIDRLIVMTLAYPINVPVISLSRNTVRNVRDVTCN